MNTQGMKTGEEPRARAQADAGALPLFFRHHDLIQNAQAGMTLERPELVNLWNSIHFMDGMVYVHLRHPRYQDELLVGVRPLPCGGGAMTCRWPVENPLLTEEASISNIILSDGLSLFLVPVRLKETQKDSFTIEIPEKAHILGRRQARHFRCRGVEAEVTQNGLRTRGVLKDFSALALAVAVGSAQTDAFRYFDADSPATVHLSRNGELILSASCRCIRQASEAGGREVVLTPAPGPASRLLTKRFRTPRVAVTPSPVITFEHPLTRKPVQMDVKNLSCSGFAVSLSPEDDVLMTRMVIPEITIHVAGAVKIHCKAQVLNRRVEKNQHIRYGFVLLDMDIETYNRLSHIVLNAIDSGIHIADAIDADQVWELLFASGFIYPKKYEMLQSYREPLKEIYRRLYGENPSILTQVTYQRNGRVYGHVSMVRSYGRTWMLQHLAARPLDQKRTGLKILKEIIRYFDGLYCLPTAGMDYLMFYFRPENRFPDRFFGDFARHLNNPRACSLDLFSYLSYPTTGPEEPLPEGWLLASCAESDLEEINRFYRKMSGGLLLDVLCLGGRDREESSLQELYARNGFTRSCRSLSLAHRGNLKAVIIVNHSDAGLSLSDFLNGIKILVNDPAGLPWTVLSAALSQLVSEYALDQIPLLIYPSDYLQTQGVVCEKRYNLWIMDVNHGREYVDFRYGRRKAHS